MDSAPPTPSWLEQKALRADSVRRTSTWVHGWEEAGWTGEHSKGRLACSWREGCMLPPQCRPKPEPIVKSSAGWSSLRVPQCIHSPVPPHQVLNLQANLPTNAAGQAEQGGGR